MKIKFLLFIVSILVSISVKSQDKFYIKIDSIEKITCGDSLLLTTKLLYPVSISFTHSYSATNFEFSIVNKDSDILVKRIYFESVKSVDTLILLPSDSYYIRGTVVPDVFAITGSVGDWIFGDVEYQLEFNVSEGVNLNDISFECLDVVYDTNIFKIAPISSQVIRVTATDKDENTANDSIELTIDPLTLNLGLDKSITCGSRIQFDSPITNYTDKNALTYSWTPIEGLSSSEIAQPLVQVATDRTYSLSISTKNGCVANDSIHVSMTSMPKPEICMVSVDSSNHNMIVWEHPIGNPYDSIIIFKETSQSDVYKKIGSHSSSNTSVFIDKNANPAQNASRYKIAVIDNCGYKTLQSEYHKTIHLTINSGINGAWNLIWDGYEGFSYSTYNIYRGTSDGNMLKIAEQASNTFTYTDLTPPVGTIYYQIEVENPNSCIISNLKSSNNYYSSARSNIVNSSQVNSIDNFSFEGFKIYPNPAVDILYIKSTTSSNYNVELLSLDGKIQFKNQNITDDTEIAISDLKSGIYLIRMTSDNKTMNMKLIKK